MKLSSLKLNIAYNVLYQILSLIVPLITAPYISRIIGKAGMGIYSYTYSIAHYFVIFIMLGILNYGNREISAIKDDDNLRRSSFWNIYSVQFLMGLVMLIIYLLYVVFLCEDYRLIFLIQSFFIISGILDISWFYFGIEKFKVTTGISALNKILTTILIFVFVKTKNDVYVYTLIIAGGTLLNNIMYWILLKNYTSRPLIKRKEIVRHIYPLLLLFLPVIAVNVYRYISKVMLGLMSGVDSVGIYDAAEKFVNLPLGIITAIGTVMLARITNMLSNDEGSGVKKYNHISMIMVMMVGMGVVFGLAAISNDFIPFFYGDDFKDSSIVLIILLPSVLFICWANVIRTQYLLPNRLDKEYCISVFVGAIVNIIVNLSLITRYGAIGAAIGTSIAEMSVCIIQSVSARRALELSVYLKDSLFLFFAGALMYYILVNISIEDVLLSILAKIIIGLVVYSTMSFYILKGILKKV